jgi:hypothetical protein
MSGTGFLGQTIVIEESLHVDMISFGNSPATFTVLDDVSVLHTTVSSFLGETQVLRQSGSTTDTRGV